MTGYGNDAVETTPPVDGEGRRGEAPVGPLPTSGGVNACLSNTHSLNRHWNGKPQETLKTKHSLQSALAAVDWFEIGGRVSWDEDDSLYEFQKLEDMFRRAQDQHCPEPWTIDGKTVLVHPGGLGSGRQSRLRYRIDWGPLLIGVSDRPSESRLLSNFYLKASGEVCLLFGLKAEVRGEILARRPPQLVLEVSRTMLSASTISKLLSHLPDPQCSTDESH